MGPHLRHIHNKFLWFILIKKTPESIYVVFLKRISVFFACVSYFNKQMKGFSLVLIIYSQET